MMLNFLSPEIENIFFQTLPPNTKLIVVRTIYQPLSQSDFLEITKTHFSKLKITINNENLHAWQFQL